MNNKSEETRKQWNRELDQHSAQIRSVAAAGGTATTTPTSKTDDDLLQREEQRNQQQNGILQEQSRLEPLDTVLARALQVSTNNTTNNGESTTTSDFLPLSKGNTTAGAPPPPSAGTTATPVATSRRSGEQQITMAKSSAPYYCYPSSTTSSSAATLPKDRYAAPKKLRTTPLSGSLAFASAALSGNDRQQPQRSLPPVVGAVAMNSADDERLHRKHQPLSHATSAAAAGGAAVSPEVVVDPAIDDSRLRECVGERLKELENNNGGRAAAPVAPQEAAAASAQDRHQQSTRQKRRRCALILMFYCISVALLAALTALVSWAVMRGKQVKQQSSAAATKKAPPQAQAQAQAPAPEPREGNSGQQEEFVARTSIPASVPIPDSTTAATPVGAVHPKEGLVAETISPIAAKAPTSSPTTKAVSSAAPSSKPPPPPCLSGHYYYTYKNGFKLGHVNAFSSNDTAVGNQDLPTPDCNLWYLAFDREGIAHGQCNYPGQETSALVTVDLQTGKTTEIARFPPPPDDNSNSSTTTTKKYKTLVYNPLDDHFYTTLLNNEDETSVLVKIEKDWTFTTVKRSYLPDEFNAFAIAAAADDDSNNHTGTSTHDAAFGVDANIPGKLYSLDVTTGTATVVDEFPVERDSASIAFHGSTLYGIGYSPPAPLFTINVTVTAVADAEDGLATKSFRTKWIKDVNVAYTEGGAFCPL